MFLKFRKKKSIIEIPSNQITYCIDNKILTLPSKHPLPEFQEKFRLYDRFLPILVSYLPEEGKIIDIGANVGDTLYATIDRCSNKIICVEAADDFYELLEFNINALSEAQRGRVSALKKMAGTGSFTGTLEQTHGGTASLKVDEKTIQNYFSLDFLIGDKTSVNLIKVDTDGFDFDVIESAKQICKESKPILFWENEISEDFQLNGFEQMYYNLSELGYDTLYIFDNFGNLIFENSNFEILKQLHTYIYSMKKYDCTRTIFYTDVLAVSNKHKDLVTNAIEDYKRSFILK